MTLNLTLITPAYTLQVSDRRMVSLPDFEVIDDQANKAVILQAKDGTFAVTFAGIGEIDGERIDLWLARKLTKLGVPELAIEEGARVIAREATKLFRRIPRCFDKTHTFVLAGRINGSTCPGAWVVTNERESQPGAPSSRFVVREHPLTGDRLLLTHGVQSSVTRADKRRLDVALRGGRGIDLAERALVDIVRSAKRRRQGSPYISDDVLAVALVRDGRARARFYPLKGPTKNFAPLFVWHDSGINIAAGGLDITPGNFAAGFGTTMLVAPPDGQASDEPGQNPRSINFRFWFDRGQNEASSPESEISIPLVQAIPLSEEMMKSFS